MRNSTKESRKKSLQFRDHTSRNIKKLNSSKDVDGTEFLIGTVTIGTSKLCIQCHRYVSNDHSRSKLCLLNPFRTASVR